MYSCIMVLTVLMGVGWNLPDYSVSVINCLEIILVSVIIVNVLSAIVA